MLDLPGAQQEPDQRPLCNVKTPRRGQARDYLQASLGAQGEGFVGGLLQKDGLVSTEHGVGGDEDLGLRIEQSVGQRLGREAGEDDRVDSTCSCEAEVGVSTKS